MGPFWLLDAFSLPSFFNKKGVIIINNQLSSLLPVGRVVISHRNNYIVEFENEKYNLEVSGRFKYMAFEKSDYPVVGDYVNFRITDNDHGIIESIHSRHGVIERRGVTNSGEKQLLAANVDVIFVCMALDKDFNITKLLNFLSLTYETDCETVILLTKKDLCEDTDPYILPLKDHHRELIIPISVYSEEDITLLEKITEDKTSIFIGSSGVGKSTIINALIGEEHFVTNTVRESDSQGRHTTSHRELINLSNGGSVIDTPGIREVHSYIINNVDEAFEDVASFAEKCKFRDCTHTNEPGCEVSEALSTGDLPNDRYASYLRIQRLNRFNRQREITRQRLQNKRKKV